MPCSPPFYGTFARAAPKRGETCFETSSHTLVHEGSKDPVRYRTFFPRKFPSGERQQQTTFIDDKWVKPPPERRS